MTTVHPLVSLADLASLWPLGWIEPPSTLAAGLYRLGRLLTLHVRAKCAFYYLFKCIFSLLGHSSLFFLNQPCLTALVHRLIESLWIAQTHFWMSNISLACRRGLCRWLLWRFIWTCPVLLQTSSCSAILPRFVLFKSEIVFVNLIVLRTWLDSICTVVAFRMLRRALRCCWLLKLSSYFIEQVLIQRLLVDLGSVCRVVGDVHGEVLING